MRPDSDHQPKNRGPNDENINRRQWQVSQPELNRREDQIGDQIDAKRQGHQPAHFAPKHLNKHKSEADENHGIEDLPDEPNRARNRCPRRFDQSVVPGCPVHLSSNSGLCCIGYCCCHRSHRRDPEYSLLFHQGGHLSMSPTATVRTRTLVNSSVSSNFPLRMSLPFAQIAELLPSVWRRRRLSR